MLASGKTLSAPIVAVHAEVWNAGRGPIKAADVLTPVSISTSPPVEILEVAIRKTTRDVVQFSASKAADPSRISLSWRILEDGDAATLQVIFAGDPKARFILDGAVVGQPKLISVDSPRFFSIERSQPRRSRDNLAKALLLAFVVFLAASWPLRVLSKLPDSRGRYVFRTILSTVFLIAMLTILIAVFGLLEVGFSPPPLDF